MTIHEFRGIRNLRSEAPVPKRFDEIVDFEPEDGPRRWVAVEFMTHPGYDVISRIRLNKMRLEDKSCASELWFGFEDTPKTMADPGVMHALRQLETFGASVKKENYSFPSSTYFDIELNLARCGQGSLLKILQNLLKHSALEEDAKERIIQASLAVALGTPMDRVLFKHYKRVFHEKFAEEKALYEYCVTQDLLNENQEIDAYLLEDHIESIMKADRGGKTMALNLNATEIEELLAIMEKESWDVLSHSGDSHPTLDIVRILEPAVLRYPALTEKVIELLSQIISSNAKKETFVALQTEVMALKDPLVLERPVVFQATDNGCAILDELRRIKSDLTWHLMSSEQDEHKKQQRQARAFPDLLGLKFKELKSDPKSVHTCGPFEHLFWSQMTNESNLVVNSERQQTCSQFFSVMPVLGPEASELDHAGNYLGALLDSHQKLSEKYQNLERKYQWKLEADDSEEEVRSPQLSLEDFSEAEEKLLKLQQEGLVLKERWLQLQAENARLMEQRFPLSTDEKTEKLETSAILETANILNRKTLYTPQSDGKKSRIDKGDAASPSPTPNLEEPTGSSKVQGKRNKRGLDQSKP